jgi:hypothetical protein
MKRIFLLLTVCVSQLAFSQTPKTRAQEELDRQLKEMMGNRPAKVKVKFVPLDEPNYELTEARFELDGAAIRTPMLKQLMGEAPVEVSVNDVSPGKHRVKAELQYTSKASAMVSDEGDHKWKIANEVSFDVAAGIEVQVNVTPKRDEKQKEIAKRFSLRMPSSPVMLAAVEDGYVAPPPPKVAVGADAGTQAVAIVKVVADAGQPAMSKAEAALEAKRLAKEKADALATAKAEKAAAAKEAVANAASDRAAKAAAAKEAATIAASERAAKLAAAKEASTNVSSDRAAKTAAAKEAAALAAADRTAKMAEAKRLATEKADAARQARADALALAKQKVADDAAAKKAKADERLAAIEQAKLDKAQALADAENAKKAAQQAIVDAEAAKVAAEQKALADAELAKNAPNVLAAAPIEAIDSGAAVIAEVIDAGVPNVPAVAAVDQVPVKTTPVVNATEESGSMNWILWAVGALGVGFILFWLARRKKND